MENAPRAMKRNRSWLKEEDDKLRQELTTKPKQNWNSVARNAGNSCRSRWLNHLNPGFRPGRLTEEEKVLIIEFRLSWGKNCWAKMATHLLPGRSDNDVKNFWHALVRKARLETCDVDSVALLKKSELVNKITAAGKTAMDYRWLISEDAYNILTTLLPGVDFGDADALLPADDFIPAWNYINSSSDFPTMSMEVRHEFPGVFGGSHEMETALGAQQEEWLLDDGGGFNQGAVAPLGINSNDTGNPYARLDGSVWGPARV